MAKHNKKTVRRKAKKTKEIKTKVVMGLCGPIVVFKKKFAAGRSVPREEELMDSCRRNKVMPWEFHHRSKVLGLPWAKGDSGEERISKLRKMGMLAE